MANPTQLSPFYKAFNTNVIRAALIDSAFGPELDAIRATPAFNVDLPAALIAAYPILKDELLSRILPVALVTRSIEFLIALNRVVGFKRTAQTITNAALYITLKQENDGRTSNRLFSVVIKAKDLPLLVKMINGHHFAAISHPPTHLGTSPNMFTRIFLKYDTSQTYWQRPEAKEILFNGVKGIRKICGSSGTPVSVQIEVGGGLDLKRVLEIQSTMNGVPMTPEISLSEATMAREKGVELVSQGRCGQALAWFAVAAYVYGRDITGLRSPRHRPADIFMVELHVLAMDACERLMKTTADRPDLSNIWSSHSSRFATNARAERRSIGLLDGASINTLGPLIVKYALNPMRRDIYTGYSTSRRILEDELKQWPGWSELVEGLAEAKRMWKAHHDLGVARMTRGGT